MNCKRSHGQHGAENMALSKKGNDMNIDKDELIKLVILVGELGWDYDRLSTSGQETYNKLCDLLGIQ